MACIKRWSQSRLTWCRLGNRPENYAEFAAVLSGVGCGPLPGSAGDDTTAAAIDRPGAETLIYLNTRQSRRQSHHQAWNEPFIHCWEEDHENDFENGGTCNLYLRVRGVVFH